MSISDLAFYRNRVYLKLCLDIVEDAYENLCQGNYDLAASELKDILETFDINDMEVTTEKAKVIDFQSN